jgi:hypothetical protein
MPLSGTGLGAEICVDRPKVRRRATLRWTSLVTVLCSEPIVAAGRCSPSAEGNCLLKG